MFGWLSQQCPLVIVWGNFVGYAPGGDEGGSRGANAGRCSAVRDDGGYGAIVLIALKTRQCHELMTKGCS